MLNILDIWEQEVGLVRNKGSFDWYDLGGTCIDIFKPGENCIYLAQRSLNVMQFVSGSTVCSLL
jgi:hypothetical protein